MKISAPSKRTALGLLSVCSLLFSSSGVCAEDPPATPSSTDKSAEAKEVGSKAKVLVYENDGAGWGKPFGVTIYGDFRYEVTDAPKSSKVIRRGKLNDAQQKTLSELLATYKKIAWTNAAFARNADDVSTTSFTLDGSGEKTSESALGPDSPLDIRFTPEVNAIFELVKQINTR